MARTATPATGCLRRYERWLKTAHTITAPSSPNIKCVSAYRSKTPGGPPSYR